MFIKIDDLVIYKTDYGRYLEILENPIAYAGFCNSQEEERHANK